jgi:hypothetical protein
MGRDRQSAGLRQFKLNWPLCLALHNHRAGQNLIAVGDVANSKIDEIAAAQLAVDGEIEHRQISNMMGVLQKIRIAQMSLGSSGGFCPISLPLFQGSRE